MFNREIFQKMLLKDGEIPQINHGDGSRRREILGGNLCISSSSLLYDRTSKLEETLEKFMQTSLTNQKNQEAYLRNLEIQVGQLAKQLSDQQRGAVFSQYSA